MRNPWERGLVIAGLIMAVAASLFVVGALMATAFGVALSGNPTSQDRWIASGLLAFIAVLVFVATMATRWSRKHAE